jgi:uncharacterized protein (TIRG00374 family)
MPSPRPPAVSWRTALVAVLTAGILWWFFRRLDFARVWLAIEQAHPGLVALTVAVVMQTYLLRAWRWQWLLQPIGRARFVPAFRTTVIGFTATFLLPGRLGEVLRPYLLARAEGFDPSATFATVIIERVLDLITVLLLFCWFLLTASIDVGAGVKLTGLVAAGVGVLGFLALLVGAGHPERLERWTGRVTRILPGRASAVASRFARSFVEGLAVMRRPGALVAASGLSVLLWLSIAVGIWTTSLAFDLTFPFPGSFLIMMFLVGGVAVPTPGGIGSFQLAYQYAVVTFFGAANDVAGAASLALWALSVAPVSVLGLAFMAQDGLTLGGLKQMRSEGGLR